MSMPRPMASEQLQPMGMNGSAYGGARAHSPTAPVELMRNSPRMAPAPLSLPEAAAIPMHPADNMPPVLDKLRTANEHAWLSIGSAAEAMEDPNRALAAYDSALLHNPYSVAALNAMASVYRSMDHFDLAVECFERVLNITPEKGEVWGAMGHCYLMMDELQKAYTAYHQALCYLPNPNEPKLWYGIGILYDRYGNLDHAEETFTSVVRMDPNYEKVNEIYFRLGIIYKQQNQYKLSLECFRYILGNPPRPLTESDIWFQIGHVYEQQHECQLAREAYEHVLSENPTHARVLQQLGWMYMQPDAGFINLGTTIELLTQSLDADPNDPQSWYLLGRAYMGAQEFNKAYESYQQAVYLDGKNPVLWCSIGILYFQINQYHDALGAYSRSIRLNPYIPEVWLNLGVLYESCNSQIADAVDAYSRSLDLDSDNVHIQQRLQRLQNTQQGDVVPVPDIPSPKDVHPSAYLSPRVDARSAPSDAAGPDGDGAPRASDARARAYAREPSPGAPPALMHAPLSVPARGRDADAPPAPTLPSYASNLAHERLDAPHPPSASRYYGQTPHEWDRQYYQGRAHGEGAPRHADDARAPVPVPSVPSRMTSSMRYPHNAKPDAPRDVLGSNGRGGHTASVRSPSAGTPRRRSGDAASGTSSPRVKRDMRTADDKPGTNGPTLDTQRRDASHGDERAEAYAPRGAWDEWQRRDESAPVDAPRDTPSARDTPPTREVAPAARVSSRAVDEDYDEGAASALMGLAGAAFEASNAERRKTDPVSAQTSPCPREPPMAGAVLGKHAQEDKQEPDASKRMRAEDRREDAEQKDAPPTSPEAGHVSDGARGLDAESAAQRESPAPADMSVEGAESGDTTPSVRGAGADPGHMPDADHGAVAVRESTAPAAAVQREPTPALPPTSSSEPPSPAPARPPVDARNSLSPSRASYEAEPRSGPSPPPTSPP
ncbi:glucose repression mediator protein [Malassezia sp. CBS 17886]|nr:glucose repression mediator protein [Malassezia sp. CBS 17886]